MYNSVIIIFIRTWMGKLAYAYRYSHACTLAGLAGGRLKRWLDASAVWGFVRSPERTSGFWKNSLFCRAVQGPVNLLLSLLRKVFEGGFKAAFRESVTGSVLSWVLNRLAAVIGLFIVVSASVPHSRWHNQYTILAAAVLAVLYILKAANDRRYHPEFEECDFTLVLFIVAAAMAAFTSIIPEDSLRTVILSLVPVFLALIMAVALRTKEDAGAVVYGIMAAAAITSLYGIWQYINHVPVDPRLVDITGWKKGVGRIFSTMGNPNNYAAFLILSLPFFGTAFFNTASKGRKLVIALLSVLPLAALALTYSRASYIGFMVSVLIFVFLKNRKYLPAILLLGLASLPLLPSSILTRMQSLGKDTSSLYRLDIWRYSAKILKEYWVTGIGPGTKAFMRLFGNFPLTMIPVHSHMFPMQIWLEFGVAGFISFFWFVGRTVKKGIAFVSGRQDLHTGNIIAACISSLAGILAVGMVEYIWFYPRVMTQFWVVIGLLLAALRLTGEEGSESIGEK